jgi:hypothetical protein
VKRWDDWRKQNWDDDQAATKQQLETLRQLEEAQARVAELESTQGAEVTLDEIKKNMDKILADGKYVRRQDLDTEIIPKLPYAQKEDVDKRIDQLSLGMEHVYANTAHYPLLHQQEFGEPMKLADLFKYMNDNKVSDFQAGYDMMVREKREKIQSEKAKKQLEEAEQRGYVKGKQERTMGADGRMPVDNLGSAPEMGHLQRRKLEAAKAKDPNAAPPLPEAPLGSGVLAEAAYQAWLKSQQGKEGVQ